MDTETLRQTLTLASAFKEGDRAVGGTTDDRLRGEARDALLSTRVCEIHEVVLIDDGVTAQLQRARDRRLDAELATRTIGSIRAALLAPDAGLRLDVVDVCLVRHRHAAGRQRVEERCPLRRVDERRVRPREDAPPTT